MRTRAWPRCTNHIYKAIENSKAYIDLDRGIGWTVAHSNPMRSRNLECSNSNGPAGKEPPLT